MSRQKVLDFDTFDSELQWHSDWCVVHALALSGGVCYLPETAAIFLSNPTSFSAKSRQWRNEKSVLLKVLDWIHHKTSPDLEQLFIKGGFLPLTVASGFRFLWFMAASGDRRRYLTPGLVKLALRNGVRAIIRTLAPRSLRSIYWNRRLDERD